jgi:hypothetical protein
MRWDYKSATNLHVVLFDVSYARAPVDVFKYRSFMKPSLVTPAIADPKRNHAVRSQRKSAVHANARTRMRMLNANAIT